MNNPILNSKGKLSKKALMIVSAIVVILLLCTCCIISIIAIYSNMEPEMTLVSPSTQSIKTNASRLEIKLRCTKIDKLFLNAEELNYREKGEICSDGKTFDLQEGLNKFDFAGIDEKGVKDKYKISIEIEYTNQDKLKAEEDAKQKAIDDQKKAEDKRKLGEEQLRVAEENKKKVFNISELINVNMQDLATKFNTPLNDAGNLVVNGYNGYFNIVVEPKVEYPLGADGKVTAIYKDYSGFVEVSILEMGNCDMSKSILDSVDKALLAVLLNPNDKGRESGMGGVKIGQASYEKFKGENKVYVSCMDETDRYKVSITSK